MATVQVQGGGAESAHRAFGTAGHVQRPAWGGRRTDGMEGQHATGKRVQVSGVHESTPETTAGGSLKANGGEWRPWRAPSFD
ncbi:hypothetical protein G6F35_013923 [Rhizopus arrhizus]|uniref:Uncharacterized protein n=1 Tax=Rhizopus oryzae TaxID=64495 RepID=A0A9P6XMK3_RHIOR|nr:hypothetical protein G6F35_013923 [Rhizopus arrhizus]KAG1526704.1 hypothetical protein G6F51_014321 [Rhizopus arrhizus]